MSHTPTLHRLVYVIPQVYAYNIGDERRAHTGFDSVLIKVEQAPVLVLILVGAGIASVTATGISAFTAGSRISSQIDLDLGHLESSTFRLESQLDSLTHSPTEVKETRPPFV